MPDYYQFVNATQLNSDLTDIADEIRTKTGGSSPIAFPNGFISEIESISTGGTQPTLFAPVVTGGLNSISWANNTQNGGFAVTIIADVDGTPVTSPLTITEQMDGSTLTITASATNFTSAVSTILLKYIGIGDSLVSVGASTATGSADELYAFIIDTYDSSYSDYRWCTFSLNGQTVVDPYIYLTPNGVKQDNTFTASFSFVPKVSKAYVDNMFYYKYGKNNDGISSQISTSLYTPTSGTIENKMTGTAVIYDAAIQTIVGTLNLSGNNYTSSRSSIWSNVSYTQGREYTVIINVNFTPKT